ncbi:MAG: ATP-dependent Clp protease proteolytic subunit [Ruminococcus sp.]|nr:ATP-dependent Clp protease proteolytic subunit [Ruminococcus sp.]
MIFPDDTKTTKYEHVIPALIAIEQDRDVEGLLILLNTMGGDVEAGLAIAEMIAGMRTPTVSLVLGGGHSIGVPLAVSADVSMIVPSASMTMHPVRTNGLVLDVPQTAIYFAKIQERVNRFITRNSRIASETLEQMIMNTQELATDIGTVISEEEAVVCDLIDQIGTPHDAVEALYHAIETTAPRYLDVPASVSGA